MLFHCNFEKFLWFTSLLYWFKEEKLSKRTDRSTNNKPLCDFQPWRQLANFQSFFTTVNSEIFCWSSLNLLSTVSIDFCRCSAFWQSKVVVPPRVSLSLVRLLGSPNHVFSHYHETLRDFAASPYQLSKKLFLNDLVRFYYAGCLAIKLFPRCFQ